MRDGSLKEEVAALWWYHTMELGDGVVTPGWFDCRAIVDRLPLPGSLAGKRCLDIGTYDGFWSFEMERRGAAEVVAIDIDDASAADWPVGSDRQLMEDFDQRKAHGAGFEIAIRALGSSVERRIRNVYDLDPEEDGMFDFVYLGSLLVHLRDPVRALERARSVCSGELVVVDSIDLPLSLLLPRRPVAAFDGRGRPWWWTANAAGLVQMVEAAGFEVAEGPHRLYMPPGRGQPVARFRPRLLFSRAGRQALVTAWRGDPHAALLARPR